jgi:small subunit ribosomal protein S17
METRSQRKERTGLVVSNMMDKSIIVEVLRRVKHTKYGKFVKRSSRFMAHDERMNAIRVIRYVSWKRGH